MTKQIIPVKEFNANFIAYGASRPFMGTNGLLKSGYVVIWEDGQREYHKSKETAQNATYEEVDHLRAHQNASDNFFNH